MSREKGNLAEEKACRYLIENGYSVIERNFYSRFGEIDIIASKEDVLHFVEVKSGEEYESAILNITPTKLSRIIKTAQVYIKKHAAQNDYTFDAIVVTPEKLVFVEDITL